MLKRLIRSILLKLPIKTTKNIFYDRMTTKIIHKVCNSRSNCIDVGCYKGEVMDEIIKAAPNGNHYGIEPIPALASELRKKYQDTNVEIIEKALSDYSGKSTYNYVTSNPSYSGLIKRKYDKAEEDTEINVEVNTLDILIDPKYKIDLIKIDVEGGELGVLKGGEKLIKRHKPVIVFEHGIGGSDVYNTRPEDVFAFFEDAGYGIYLLEGFWKKENKMSGAAFSKQYNEQINYYFVASVFNT